MRRIGFVEVFSVTAIMPNPIEVVLYQLGMDLSPFIFLTSTFSVEVLREIPIDFIDNPLMLRK